MINLLRAGPWFNRAAANTAQAADALDELFRELVDSQYKRTYNLILRMVRTDCDAADLTQETFVRIYRALPKLREGAAASAWTRRIATNLCLDFLRRRNASPNLASLDNRPSDTSEFGAQRDVIDPTGEPDRLFASAESKQMLYKAIDSLPTDYRSVIVLHHIEDMRVEEIAEIFRVPAGTIKSRLSRARRELKRKLSAYFDYASSRD